MEIHEESRPHIRSFEYQKYNSSLFSARVLDPLSETILARIPDETNSNIFTLIGVSALSFSYVLSLVYISSLTFIVTAVALLVYQLCDTLNQKNAIKNQANSIITILYDHLGDHVACCLIVLTFSNLLQISSEAQWLLFPLFSLIPFYLKYLNLYYLDKMVLDKINPVDEGVFFLQIICWISAISPNIWVQQVLFMKAGSLFILIAFILLVIFLVRTILESRDVKEERFSFQNFLPIVSTLYVFLSYSIMNSYVLKFSMVIRIIEWSFILVHTLIIGRILIYHASGEKFKPVSLGYLLLIISNIIISAGVWAIDIKEKIIICDMLALIIMVLAVSYAVVWVSNMVHTLRGILHS